MSIESYIWKEKRVNYTDPQVSKRLVDMSFYELRRAFEQSKLMLYNDSKIDPGRYVVLSEISKQINNCTAELAIRWLCQLTNDKRELKYTRFSLLVEIKEIINIIKCNYPEDHIFRLQDCYSGLPIDFNSVTIDSVIKGCKETLGKFNKKSLTKNFIVKQGLWLTREEFNEFKEIEKLNSIPEIIDTIKKRFNINNKCELKVKPQGLSYNQFRAMINLTVNKRYSDLTTMQLETLKSKVLFNLEEEILIHIRIWENLITQIKEVANYKGLIL